MLVTSYRNRRTISLGTLPAVTPRGTTRGKVTVLSEKSLSRMGRALDELEAEYQFMGTLTVGAEFSRNPDDFRLAVGEFLRFFLEKMQGFSLEPEKEGLFWWLEWQKRGAPHLHFFYTSPVPWQEGSEKWAELLHKYNLAGSDETSIAKTSTKFEKLRVHRTQASRYALKYAKKAEQKDAPDWWQGRWWGVRGNKKSGRVHLSARINEQMPAGQKALERLHKARKAMGKAVAAGIVRVCGWEYGAGETYTLARGQTAWPKDILATMALLESTISLLKGKPDD